MDYAEYTEQGRVAELSGDLARAEACFRACIDLQPKHAQSHYNLGVVLARLRRYAEALTSFTSSIRLKPDFAEAYTNGGYCLIELGKIDLARQSFAAAHQLNPDDRIALLNEGMACLSLGNFTEGWGKFEARWLRSGTKLVHQKTNKPLWRGEPVMGKTILVDAEEGFGDTLQMLRYVPLLEQAGARVILHVPAALVRLCASLSPTVQIVPHGESLSEFDYSVPVLSLPIGFITDQVGAIPAAVPYLCAEPALAAEWRGFLPQDNRKRVGLVWAGRPAHERDFHRSVQLGAITPLLGRHDSAWINLQPNLSPMDTEKFQQLGGIVLPRLLRDFADTAAVVDALDLVVTVDTAVAHLAGAMGKPTWIMLPWSADWRWMTERTDTPWYPTAKLYRQTHPRDWDGVVARIRDDI